MLPKKKKKIKKKLLRGSPRKKHNFPSQCKKNRSWKSAPAPRPQMINGKPLSQKLPVRHVTLFMALPCAQGYLYSNLQIEVM